MILRILVYVYPYYIPAHNISNLRFKQNINQVGTFSFNLTPASTEGTYLKEKRTVTIFVNGKRRFQGYIKKISYDRQSNTYYVEGESIEGILNTKSTSSPIVVRMKDDGTLLTTKQLMHEAVFRFGGFERVTESWSIIGDDGIRIPFYKFEVQNVVDQVTNLARISGCDWRCYALI